MGGSLSVSTQLQNTAKAAKDYSAVLGGAAFLLTGAWYLGTSSEKQRAEAKALQRQNAANDEVTRTKLAAAQHQIAANEEVRRIKLAAMEKVARAKQAATEEVIRAEAAQTREAMANARAEQAARPLDLMTHGDRQVP